MKSARDADRSALTGRFAIDFRDYGFIMTGPLDVDFDVHVVRVDDEEAFLFFYPKDAEIQGRFAVLNFHCFLKYTGSLEEFVRSRGASVASVPLHKTVVFGVDGLTYSRRISMAELFAGAHQVIDFIGGEPQMSVRDSHIYFQHRHAHFYLGMLHQADDNAHYDVLRERLLSLVELV